jgi:hypothetical protein
MMFYQLRSNFHYAYFKYQTRGIHKTPPLPCDPSAPCDLHTMLGLRDAPLYLVAIKSLLRFGPPVAVVIHSDGTLTPEWEATLRRHVPGCEVVSPAEGEERAAKALGKGSDIFRYRSLDINYRRLIDTEVWSGRKKKIIMDADILVPRAPQEVLSWIAEGEAPFLLGAPAHAGGPAGGGNHVQTIFQERLASISAAVGLPAVFLDGGTGGFYGSSGEMTFEHIEGVIRACQKLGVPLERWGSDQCVIIYLLSASGACRLNTDRYFNFCPADVARLGEAEVVHFYGTHRFYQNLYGGLAARAVRELSQAPAACPQ